MSDTYWDDDWDQDESNSLSDDLSSDDFSSEYIDDDGDSFEVHTFDTGELRHARRDQTAKPKFPTTPVTHDDDRAAIDDDLIENDTFTSITVEPDIESQREWEPGRASMPIRAAQSSFRPVTHSPTHQSQARPRRRRERTHNPPSTFLITLRTFFIVLAAAVLVSTIFSLWTQPGFFTDEFRAGLNQVQATQRVISIQPSPLPTETRQIRIGIVAGHTGPPLQEGLPEDPGAVCDDGLTERRINEAVAREVVAALRRDQYTVDLLEEFDDRLHGYQADVLVSVHTNDCQDYGAAGTGYNVASAQARQTTAGQDERLLNCLIVQYGATTGLPRHQGVTYDMTEYHTFGEVAVDTPTAIIEIGFMRNDRPMLLNQQSLVAQGIANGIRCFLRPDLYGEVTVQ